MKTQNIYLALFLICVLGLSVSIINGLTSVIWLWVLGMYAFMVLTAVNNVISGIKVLSKSKYIRIAAMFSIAMIFSVLLQNKTLFIINLLGFANSVIAGVYSWRKKVNKPRPYYNMNGEEVEKQAMEDELKGMSTKGIFNHDNYDSQFD